MTRRAKSLVLAGFLASGTLFFSLGLVGDSLGWWDRWGYLSNIVAGCTGACFGIPFAAVAVQWYVKQSSDSRAMRDADRLVCRAVEAMSKEVDRLSDGPSANLYMIYMDMRAAWLELVELTPSAVRGAEGDARRLELLDEYLRGLNRDLSFIFLAQEGPSRRSWALIRNRWRLVRDEPLPRLQLLEVEQIRIRDEELEALDAFARLEYPPFAAVTNLKNSLSQAFAGSSRRSSGISDDAHRLVFESLPVDFTNKFEEAGLELEALLSFEAQLKIVLNPSERQSPGRPASFRSSRDRGRGFV